MAAKMSLCTISYNYEHYAGIDVEKLSNIIYEYVKKEFADFNPQEIGRASCRERV